MNPILPTRPDVALFMILAYAIFAFALGLVLTPWFISFLRRNSLGKQLRVETVDGREPTIFRQYHQKKFGTPTMGGLLIWLSIFATVIFSRALSYFGIVDASLLQRGQVYLPLFVLFTMGVLGALDDYFNIVSSSDERMQEAMPTLKKMVIISGLFTLLAAAALIWFGGGLPGEVSALGTIGGLILILLATGFLLLFRTGATMLDAPFRKLIFSQGKKKGLGVFPKLASLLLISVVGALWFHFKLGYSSIAIPFYGSVEIGPWYLLLFIFILVATSNAVNVTDGLDGLAGGLLIIAFSGFGLLAYLQGFAVLAAFCAITVGAVAAFLWHNVPPALFYMGDTGALALGGTLGVIALMTDQVLLLPLLGFVFVIEMLSVIIQLTSKKLRGGKKIFKAAPIHHHFEALEWGESKVTMRLWIIGACAALFGILIGVKGHVASIKASPLNPSTVNQVMVP
jgi:phospho-N-acetylmuramoyl-pentapeptide-transferase